MSRRFRTGPAVLFSLQASELGLGRGIRTSQLLLEGRRLNTYVPHRGCILALEPESMRARIECGGRPATVDGVCGVMRVREEFLTSRDGTRQRANSDFPG